MIALLPLLRHRATLGVAISLGVLVAVWGNGAVKYRQGYSDGRGDERTISWNAAALAKMATDSAWLVALNAGLRDRDRAMHAEKAAARATARETAERALADALAAYHADTTPQCPSCAALASSCANAAATFRAEVDSISRVSALKDTALTRADSLIRTEPVRVGIAVKSGIEQFRATYRPPSRSKWAAIGAGAGALGLWLLQVVR